MTVFPRSPGRMPSASSPRRSRRPFALVPAVLVAVGAFASGTLGAETKAIGGEPDEGRDGGGVADEESVAGATSVQTLRPRWIEPRRRERAPQNAPPANAMAGTSAVIGTMPMSDRTPSSGRASRAPALAEAGSVPPKKDWRQASRIVIHGERVNEELSTLTAELLTTLGAEEVEHRRVRTSSEVDQIRYFHTADERMARELAAALEPEFGRVPVRDFTAYTPSPESGLLEMWLR